MEKLVSKRMLLFLAYVTKQNKPHTIRTCYGFEIYADSTVRYNFSFPSVE